MTVMIEFKNTRCWAWLRCNTHVLWSKVDFMKGPVLLDGMRVISLQHEPVTSWSLVEEDDFIAKHGYPGVKSNSRSALFFCPALYLTGGGEVVSVGRHRAAVFLDNTNEVALTTSATMNMTATSNQQRHSLCRAYLLHGERKGSYKTHW